MKKINISTLKYPNTFTLVDEEDYEYLSQWKWHCDSYGYVVRGGKRYKKKRSMISLHRLVNNTPDGMATDHINRNKLDNRKFNLRSCTKSQNNKNLGMRQNNISGYKGVSWCNQTKKWRAQISNNQHYQHIGRFSIKEDAAKAYNKKAKELFGEFAGVNQ